MLPPCPWCRRRPKSLNDAERHRAVCWRRPRAEAC